MRWDTWVYAALLMVASTSAIPYLYAMVRNRLVPPTPPADLWRQKWTATLIDLQTELEARKVEPAVKLCRELIWLICGGDNKR
jgi:hypothetical protein